MSKTGFVSKLIRLNRKITSIKTNYLEAQKKLNSPTTKNCNFFFGRMYFTSNDRSKNMFAYRTSTW